MAAGVVVAGAVVAAVVLWPSGDGEPTGASLSSASTSAAASGSSASASPTRVYPLSQAPRTIPAVREHTPARGPGWRPAAGGRVVVDDSRPRRRGEADGGGTQTVLRGADTGPRR